MTLLVTLYTKPGCHLCHQTRAELDLLAVRTEIQITEIDITSDPALFERFRYLIPVVDVQDGPMLMPPITMQDLQAALGAAVGRTESHG